MTFSVQYSNIIQYSFALNYNGIFTAQHNQGQLMTERDENGRFVKGNKVAKGHGRPTEVDDRKATREEVMKCAQTLTLPISTMSDDGKNINLSRLQYLTNQAVRERDTAFIKWLVEMAIGKPKSVIEAPNGEAFKEIKLSYKLD